MNKIKNIFGVLFLGIALTVSIPGFAQDDDNDRKRDNDRKEARSDRDRNDDSMRDDDDREAKGDNDDGDSGKWGLLGLAGLLGLIPRKRHDDVKRTTIVGDQGRSGLGGTTGSGTGSSIINP